MKNRYKLVIITIFLLALLFIVFKPQFYSLFNKENLSRFSEENIKNFINGFGIWAPIIFWFVNFVAALLFFPITLFSLVCGALFGKSTGTCLLVSSSTLAAIAAFFIGRRFDNLIYTSLNRGDKINKWIEKIETLLHKNGFQAIFIIRNIPPPFILLSYAAGLIKTTKFKDFASATFVVLVIRGFAFVYLGDSILKGPKALIIPALLITAITVFSILIKKFNSKTNE